MRVVNYQRVSTKNQDLHRQTRLCEEYCEKNGHEVVMTISEQISGKTTDKESITKLLSVTNADADLCVVSELSRITREEDYDKIIYYIRCLKENGIDVVFLDEPDTVYRHDEPFSLIQLITLIVRAEGANQELNKIKTRMASGLKDKLLSHAYMVCGQVPFGYESYPNPDYVLGKTPKTLMRQNPREVAAIKVGYDMILRGKSCGAVAEYWNSLGLFHHSKTKGKLWRNEEVNKLLKSKLYIGERRAKGIVHRVEPIIEIEIYNAVLEKMSKHRCVITKKNKRFNPVKGLLFCGHCGAPMGVVLSKTGDLQFYCLSKNLKNPDKTYKFECHDQSMIKYKKLMAVIDKLTKTYLSTDEYLKKTAVTKTDILEEITRINRKMDDYIKDRKEIKTEITKVKKQITAITDEYLLKLLEEKFVELNNQKKDKEQKIRELQKRSGELSMRIGDITTKPISIKKMDIYEKSDFYHKVISKIEWFGKKHKTLGQVVITFKNGAVKEVITKTI